MQTPRKGGKKSVLSTSPHKDEYIRLMKDGWTSNSLSRYAAYRYGEDIAAATFRGYKMRQKIQTDASVLLGKAQEDGVGRVDVMAAREELVLLQMQRIAIDTKHERDMSKLFSTTSREIQLLSTLLDQVKTDQQDYGILPKVADKQEVVVGPAPGEAPKDRSLGDLLGISSPAEAAAAAKRLHNVIPIERKAGA